MGEFGIEMKQSFGGMNRFSAMVNSSKPVHGENCHIMQNQGISLFSFHRGTR
jgi:hypothetical protein